MIAVSHGGPGHLGGERLQPTAKPELDAAAWARTGRPLGPSLHLTPLTHPAGAGHAPERYLRLVPQGSQVTY